MYRGSNKTALASQHQIADAMLRMLDETPYGDISVSAVCREANVSRQTFYTLFQSKENVIIYSLRNDCCYSEGEESVPDLEFTFRDLCDGFSEYIIHHARVLELLADNDLLPLLRTVLREDFSECGSLMSVISPRLRPYAFDYMAAGITSIAETYIRSGRDTDCEELADIICCLMGGICGEP